MSSKSCHVVLCFFLSLVFRLELSGNSNGKIRTHVSLVIAFPSSLTTVFFLSHDDAPLPMTLRDLEGREMDEMQLKLIRYIPAKTM